MLDYGTLTKHAFFSCPFSHLSKDGVELHAEGNVRKDVNRESKEHVLHVNRVAFRVLHHHVEPLRQVLDLLGRNEGAIPHEVAGEHVGGDLAVNLPEGAVGGENSLTEKL